MTANFIKKWKEFLSEAILYTSDEFKNTLDNIQSQFDEDKYDNDLPSKLHDSIDEDIKDLIINCISINKEKNDVINFIPSNKLKNYYFIFDHDDNIIDDKKIYKYYDIKKPDDSTINKLAHLNPYEYKLVDELEINDYIKKRLVDSIIYYGEIKEMKSIYHFCSKDGIDFLVYNPIKTLKKDLNIKYQEIKIGRAIRQIFKNLDIKVSDKDIEKFVNAYKAYIDYIKADKIVELVKGDDIKHWYLDSNNYGHGQLSNSCMRYKSCQTYFDIYTKNPEVCQLLILRSPDVNKIIGRALLWKLTNGRLYMDRIYCNIDSDINIFLKWAKDNNVSYTYNKFVDNEIDMSVQLNKIKYIQYPYMDTFTYFDRKSCILSSFSLTSYIGLQDTDGGISGSFNIKKCSLCNGSGSESCDKCKGDGVITCDVCDGDGDIYENSEFIPCKNCKETGLVECPKCNGSTKQECKRCEGEGE
jgi:hypothetical protein